MRILLPSFLALILICSPALARPFEYNAAYGPEYFYFSSSKTGTSANLLTCGIVCRGNILDRFNAEFRGGVGEISSTKISYNELSLLYKTSGRSGSFWGLGPSFLTYDNILDKTSGLKIHSRELNAKFVWAQAIDRTWGYYLSAVGPATASYDLSLIAYFDQNLGDFNVRLGYKSLKFSEGSSMSGPYIASSIYF